MGMSVIRAQIQTVEEIYRLVWTAVANKHPIEAVYKGRSRCSARTDWAGTVKDGFACRVISMAATARAVSRRWARLQTGVVLRSKSSAG
jgi:hypothetical protein